MLLAGGRGDWRQASPAYDKEWTERNWAARPSGWEIRCSALRVGRARGTLWGGWGLPASASPVCLWAGRNFGTGERTKEVGITGHARNSRSSSLTHIAMAGMPLVGLIPLALLQCVITPSVTLRVRLIRRQKRDRAEWPSSARSTSAQYCGTRTFWSITTRAPWLPSWFLRPLRRTHAHQPARCQALPLRAHSCR